MGVNHARACCFPILCTDNTKLLGCWRVVRVQLVTPALELPFCFIIPLAYASGSSFSAAPPTLPILYFFLRLSHSPVLMSPFVLSARSPPTCVTCAFRCTPMPSPPPPVSGSLPAAPESERCSSPRVPRRFLGPVCGAARVIPPPMAGGCRGWVLVAPLQPGNRLPIQSNPIYIYIYIYI